MDKRKKDRHIGFRIDDETLYKLHYIASYEGRSANGHLLHVLRQNIKAFEEANGKIEYPPKEEA